MLAGGFGGTLVGALLFRMLEQMGQIDFVILLLYIILLGGIGLMMVFELIKSRLSKKSQMRKAFNTSKVHPLIAALPFKMRFEHSRLYISAFMPFVIGFVGGVLASVLGIGGGFILVPAMIYILGMPTILVAGTSLFQMIFTTGFATIMHATLNNTVDIMLAVILIVGGVIGAQIGVGFTRFVRGVMARVLLSVIVLSVAVKLCFDVFVEPLELFSTVNLVRGAL